MEEEEEGGRGDNERTRKEIVFCVKSQLRSVKQLVGLSPRIEPTMISLFSNTRRFHGGTRGVECR